MRRCTVAVAYGSESGLGTCHEPQAEEPPFVVSTTTGKGYCWGLVQGFALFTLTSVGVFGHAS